MDAPVSLIDGSIVSSRYRRRIRLFIYKKDERSPFTRGKMSTTYLNVVSLFLLFGHSHNQIAGALEGKQMRFFPFEVDFVHFYISFQLCVFTGKKT